MGTERDEVDLLRVLWMEILVHGTRSVLSIREQLSNEDELKEND